MYHLFHPFKSNFIKPFLFHPFKSNFFESVSGTSFCWRLRTWEAYYFFFTLKLFCFFLFLLVSAHRCVYFVLTSWKFVINFVLVFEMVNLSSVWEEKELLCYSTLILQMCLKIRNQTQSKASHICLTLRAGWILYVNWVAFSVSNAKRGRSMLNTFEKEKPPILSKHRQKLIRVRILILRVNLETSGNMLAFPWTPFKSSVKDIPQVKNAGIKPKRLWFLKLFKYIKDSFGIQYPYSHNKEFQLLLLWYCKYLPHLLPSSVLWCCT